MNKVNEPLLILLVLMSMVFINNKLQAQTKVGFRGGLNISRLIHYFNGNKFEGQEAVNKIEAGIFIEHSLNSRFRYLGELNYFESGISIPSFPFQLSIRSFETNSILKFQILKGSLQPSVFGGVGLSRYLTAVREDGSTFDLGSDHLNEYGIGYLIGAQMEYNIERYTIFFDTRFKNSLSLFIDNDKNEDFTIKVKKQESIFSLGFKYKLK